MNVFGSQKKTAWNPFRPETGDFPGFHFQISFWDGPNPEMGSSFG